MNSDENDDEKIKIYHENALKEEYLISISDTAFATSLLYDWVLNMKCGHQAFNTMVIPIGLLQPPLFWTKPQALTFGAFGIIAGNKHFCLHSFILG